MKKKRKVSDSIPRLILRKLMEVEELTLDAFFPKKYPWAAISRPLFGLDSYPCVSARTLSSTLSRLKRQGLIARSGKARNSRWYITDDGENWLQEIIPTEDLPPIDGVTRMVVFDIPERERKKRDAIRAELSTCDFKQLQKSVWIGKRPLPESFIKLLGEWELKNKVHIFSINEQGTIEDE